MWILGVAGTQIEIVASAGEYIYDAAGNWYYNEGGHVTDSSGEYVGTFYNDAGGFLADTRDAALETVGSIGQSFAVSSGVALAAVGIVAAWFLYKVVK